MILLYIDSGWEKDYIIKYLLKDIHFTNYFVIFNEQLSDSFIRKLCSISSDFIVVFSSNSMSYIMIESLLAKLKPKIVFHNSDEVGNRKEFLQLSHHVPLTFMQYGFHYDLPTNIYHIPVGYLPGVHIGGVPDFDSIIPPKQRQYDWAFIGGLKSDREYAINMFKTLWQHSVYFVGQTSTKEVGDLYKNTRFVIAPRGNVNLMCCRVFEAVTCGAIPVIANCSKEEMERTFTFFGKKPPFVYGHTWEDAVHVCISSQDLDELQQRCVNWYKSITQSIQTKIQKVLTS
jgi:hypothetical protein